MTAIRYRSYGRGVPLCIIVQIKNLAISSHALLQRERNQKAKKSPRRQEKSLSSLNRTFPGQQRASSLIKMKKGADFMNLKIRLSKWIYEDSHFYCRHSPQLGLDALFLQTSDSRPRLVVYVRETKSQRPGAHKEPGDNHIYVNPITGEKCDDEFQPGSLILFSARALKHYQASFRVPGMLDEKHFIRLRELMLLDAGIKDEPYED